MQILECKVYFFINFHPFYRMLVNPATNFAVMISFNDSQHWA